MPKPSVAAADSAADSIVKNLKTWDIVEAAVASDDRTSTTKSLRRKPSVILT
jgi:hypothetical protein